MQQCFSINETCSLLGIGKTYLYQLINSKKIQAKKIGKRTVFLQSDLDAFLSALEDYPSHCGGVE